MEHGGRFAYWIAMAFSGLWLLIALAWSVGLLFALARGSEHFGEHSTTELVIGTIMVLQPLLIGGLIVRAHRLRMIGSTVSIIGRAAMPMSTVALLIAAVAANTFYERSAFEKLMWQARNRTITYDCSRESKSVDFNPQQIGPIGMRLTSIRREQQPEEWLVTWPGQAPIAAANFYVDTGSIGGSHGLSWSDADGRNMVAILSFNDIVLSPYGAASIWVTLREGTVTEILGKWYGFPRPDFTCELDPKTYRPAS